MKAVLIVLDDKALAYYRQVEDPGMTICAHVLSAPGSLRGQKYHDFQQVYLAGERYRLAGPKDFEKFKVVFDGYKDDPEYIHTKSPEAKEVRAEIFSKLYEEKEAQDELYGRAADAVGQFNHLRGDMGLLPDDVRTSDEYRSVKRILDREFEEVRKINGYLSKHYKPELRAERKARRGF